MVLGGSADHGWATDVNIFYDIIFTGVTRNRGLEGVKIDNK